MIFNKNQGRSCLSFLYCMLKSVVKKTTVFKKSVGTFWLGWCNYTYLSLSIPLYFAVFWVFFFLGLWSFFYSVFSPIFFLLFWVGLQMYFRNYSPFSREHILKVFTGFLLLCVVALSFIFSGHRGLFFFQRMRWDFTCVQCNVCTETGLQSHLRRLGIL